MKHLKHFYNFSLNENVKKVFESSGNNYVAPNISPMVLDTILNAMEKETSVAISIYFAFEKLPHFFSKLEAQGLSNNKPLKSIISSHIKKDPSQLHLLDGHPELKAEIIKMSNVEDFSKIGRLKNLGIIK